MKLEEIMREQERQGEREREEGRRIAAKASAVVQSGIGARTWARMNSEEVNQILRLQNGMLRDAAATDVYFSMLLAKAGSRSNFSGPRIEGRTLKLSEALEGALGKPPPRDLRRPRQLVKIDSAAAPPPSEDAAKGQSEGAGPSPEEAEEESRNVPPTASALPRAVRVSIEDAMLHLLAVQDMDKIAFPSSQTRERRATVVRELHALLHVTPSKGCMPPDNFIPVAADSNTMTQASLSSDAFFVQLLLVPKGCKMLLRSMHLFDPQDATDVLCQMLRCLPPLAYLSATGKEATGIELLVQLLVKLVYSLDILRLTNVLQGLLAAYTDAGLHLMACTKLGALALAALLRRGHDEYMSHDNSQPSPQETTNLLAWAAVCSTLIRRFSGGLEGVFMAATQHAVTGLPPSIITDAEVMVDLLYELGANADQDQRALICRELASAALRTGNPQVQEQVTQLLQSLNFTT